jgi:hypothetical protein
LLNSILSDFLAVSDQASSCNGRPNDKTTTYPSSDSAQLQGSAQRIDHPQHVSQPHPHVLGVYPIGIFDGY